ncbi:FG-GAP-like repeat-containing protein [Lacinutrix iliipiscaria]|uniref:FG-GAP-like repeat-containing protein n=1 Tax=Lacinutrix iliipiscaria TaxID=1230532 RepID=A0ABW5WRE1_9FLAO
MIKNYLFSLFMFVSYGVLYSQINFENQVEALGIGVNSGLSFFGNGVSFYDYNNDGWDDISIATEQGTKIRFFKNENGTFVEDNSIDLPINTDEQKQINWVDIDNDGDKDLFVTSNNNGNKLYLNTGNLVFQDITISSGLPSTNLQSYGASWGDYNNDSFLDIFVSNRAQLDDQQNFLFKNNGDGTFTDVTLLAGIDDGSHMSFCSAFFDFNNDGWQDLYISSDKFTNQNFLYKNNGDGTFTDISATSGTGIFIDAMTTTIGDFNNDGWFDIYVTNTYSGNVFFKNNGDGSTFTDITLSTGTGFYSIGWGAVFLDAENDTDLDLYVSGEFDGSFNDYLSAAFYENIGSEMYNISNDSGFAGDTRASFSNAIGDVDNDGYPEIVVNNSSYDDLFLWKNQSPHTNNWLKVKLEGVQSNRDGIGATIEISVDGHKQYRYTHCGEGYLAQNSGTEFFGLGLETEIDYIKVTWLSGIEDVLSNVNSNETITIVEGSTLSLENNSFESFKYYPNPVQNKLTIKAQSRVEHISIFNSIGQKVNSLSPNLMMTEINVSHLESGVYLVKVIIDYKIEYFKMIKK